jgi:pyruvate dehydrogenase E2 component (dihydrolipoamide acetyltransferase)
MTEVIMPKMGDGMEEGTLLEWLKKDGDTVKSGEVIGNIQTDKATLELESPGKGTLTGFLIKPGDTVPVGQPIAAILKDGEKLPEGWGGGKTAAPAPTKEEAPVEEAAPAKEEPVQAETPKADAPKAEAAPEEKAKGTRIKASPLAKKVAAEAGVDLSMVEGSGPGGRIVEKDVRKAIEQQGTKIPALASAAQQFAAGEDVKVPLNRLRQVIADRTQKAKQEAPHFYVTVEVDVEKIMALRSMFKEEEAGSISVNDFVIKACALALRDMPQANSTFKGDYLLQHGAIHVGMAVALDDGLIVPVIKHADQLTLRQISAASRDLAGRARDGKLSLDEMSGSTFSISNMGMLNVDAFGAIINTPNSAIIAVATAKKVVVVNDDDELEVRMRMNLTGSFDHRVLDGAVGAKFMNVVRDYLQAPAKLLS